VFCIIHYLSASSLGLSASLGTRLSPWKPLPFAHALARTSLLRLSIAEKSILNLGSAAAGNVGAPTANGTPDDRICSAVIACLSIPAVPCSLHGLFSAPRIAAGSAPAIRIRPRPSLNMRGLAARCPALENLAALVEKLPFLSWWPPAAQGFCLFVRPRLLGFMPIHSLRGAI
jgi:hypothetical protein